MSISNIMSNISANFQRVQNPIQFPVKFNQLGQDLQSGNLSAAQSDFSALQQLQSHGVSTSSTQATTSLQQEINQLSQDLQSGNLTAAQKDIQTIQQDFQSSGTHMHHHHHGGGGGGEGVNQLFAELGDSLQAGNLSAAQQVYNALAQDLPEFAQGGAQPQLTSASALSMTG